MKCLSIYLTEGLKIYMLKLEKMVIEIKDELNK